MIEACGRTSAQRGGHATGRRTRPAQPTLQPQAPCTSPPTKLTPPHRSDHSTAAAGPRQSPASTHLVVDAAARLQLHHRLLGPRGAVKGRRVPRLPLLLQGKAGGLRRAAAQGRDGAEGVGNRGHSSAEAARRQHPHGSGGAGCATAASAQALPAATSSCMGPAARLVLSTTQRIPPPPPHLRQVLAGAAAAALLGAAAALVLLLVLAGRCRCRLVLLFLLPLVARVAARAAAALLLLGLGLALLQAGRQAAGRVWRQSSGCDAGTHRHAAGRPIAATQSIASAHCCPGCPWRACRCPCARTARCGTWGRSAARAQEPGVWASRRRRGERRRRPCVQQAAAGARAGGWITFGQRSDVPESPCPPTLVATCSTALHDRQRLWAKGSLPSALPLRGEVGWESAMGRAGPARPPRLYDELKRVVSLPGLSADAVAAL